MKFVSNFEVKHDCVLFQDFKREQDKFSFIISTEMCGKNFGNGNELDPLCNIYCIV
jgi:hypothetical protein